MKTHHMPGFQRDARYARVLPSRRLDRLPPHARPRPQGQAHGRPHGRREEAPCRTSSSSRSTPTRTCCWSGRGPGARNGFVVIRNAKKKAGHEGEAQGPGRTEDKSKNPMKASKAGAGAAKPAAAKPPRSSSPTGGACPSSAIAPTATTSSTGAPSSRLRRALGLQARRDRSEAPRHHLFRRGERVLDLGCRPGSWLQYAATMVGPDGRAGRRSTATPLDKPIPGARILVGDVFTASIARSCCGALDGLRRRALGHGARHERRALARSGALGGAVRARARDRRADAGHGGHFVGKLFQGPDWQRLLKRARDRLRRGADHQAGELAQGVDRAVRVGLRRRSALSPPGYLSCLKARLTALASVAVGATSRYFL